MIESGAVIDVNREVLFWHLPLGRSSGSLPDSRPLWDVIWESFQEGSLLGFAHSHPGSGVPAPSYTDVTTFAAIETALGRRLVWWITSADQVIELTWAGPDKLQYVATVVTEATLSWPDKLRSLSTASSKI